jgi:quercetin dioxygenase-like cupin family protein
MSTNNESAPAYPIGDADPSSLGEAFWMGGSLLLVRISSSQTDGRFLLTESFSPSGHGPRVQRFPFEERVYQILDGELTFLIDGKESVARTGAVVHVPAGVPHTYRVDSPTPARWLLFSMPGRQWENYIRAIAFPATSLTLTPSSIQLLPMEVVNRAVVANGFEVVGPHMSGATRMGKGPER